MQIFIIPRDLPRDRLLASISGFLGRLPLGSAWKVEVCEHKPKRSDQQNRYLYGVVYATLQKVLPGWDKDDIHQYLLGEHFGWERLEGMGKVRLRPLRRSSRLNKQEFADYVDFCIRTAAQHGVYVPEPGEMEAA